MKDLEIKENINLYFSLKEKIEKNDFEYIIQKNTLNVIYIITKVISGRRFYKWII